MYKINLSARVAGTINSVGVFWVKTGINELCEAEILKIMEHCDACGEFSIAHDLDIILSNGDKSIVHDIVNC